MNLGHRKRVCLAIGPNIYVTCRCCLTGILTFRSTNKRYKSAIRGKLRSWQKRQDAIIAGE